MKFYITKEIKNKISGVEVVLLPVVNLKIKKDKSILTKSELKSELEKSSKRNFYDQEMFRLYREFYKDLGFDPQKTLPSVESIYKRYNDQKVLPNVNNIVDAVNLVALKTFVPLGVFNSDAIKGDIILRFSKKGEGFKPLGGGKEKLEDGLVVMADDEKILSRFFYRDSVHQKVDKKTRNVLILGCKVSGVELNVVKDAVKKAGKLLGKNCEGSKGEMYLSEVKDSKVVINIGEVSKMNTFDRLKKFLSDKKIPHKMLDSKTDSLDLDEQINALNMKYRQGMGTLLFKTEDGRFIAFLRRDDRSVDLKKFRQILKVESLEMCDIFNLQELNFENGLLAPLLLDERVEIYIDKATLEMKKMICGAGDAGHALEIKKEDLLKNLYSYKVIDVTFPNPFRQDADNVKIQRVLSGITPSGNALHIGNYFGAVKPQMDLQKKIEKSFYFVADLHALTTIQDKEKLENNIVSNVLDFIALGLDPKRSAYFRQSDVPAHCQLAIVLGNYIPFGLMKRMHAFKDKLQKGVKVDSINMGLFNYPILMAADILLYKPDGVPVGEDQRQHIELSRDVAQAFNRAYDMEFFQLPEALIQSGFASKVVGTDGERKMSKSLGNVIGIFEDDETIRKQIMSCYTDPNRIRVTDLGKVDGNPIFIYHDLINKDKEEVNDLKSRYRSGKVGDVEVKEKLFEAHKKRFKEAREKRKKIEDNINLAKDILREGARDAEKFAEETLEEVYEVIGIKNNLSVLFSND